jgi:hypothetical protein
MEQSKRRWHEKTCGERDWDNPGRPGKGGLKLVQPSPLLASNRE